MMVLYMLGDIRRLREGGERRHEWVNDDDIKALVWGRDDGWMAVVLLVRW